MSVSDQQYRVLNATRGTTLATSSKKANNFVSRGIGLMGRRSLPSDGGLIIPGCSSVITFFMRFPLDVIFVDAQGNACHTIQRMPPWRTSKIVRGSKLVVELPPGTLDATGTEPGDRIEIQPA